LSEDAPIAEGTEEDTMAAQIRVYLTPQEAEHGTIRMVRPPDGRWVQVSVPPTPGDAVLVLPSEFGDVRVHVTVVPPGISGPDARGGRRGWRVSARVGAAVLVIVLGLITVLLIMLIHRDFIGHH
jgi:hypothetical protein